MKQIFIICALLILMMPLAYAVDTEQLHSLTLLSVTETKNGSLEGGTATLYLQVKPGTGSVFLESYPAVKVDTQTATRMAQEIACEFTDVDCQRYDFFYTIQASSPIIGGPSAGGATALLTLSVLEEEPLKDSLAMTGAIGSGGIIVPVSGIRKKIDGAIAENIKLALVPALSLMDENATQNDSFLNQSQHIFNTTENTTFFEEEPLTLSSLQQSEIHVISVLTLQEAYRSATQNEVSLPESSELKISPAYVNEMKTTAETLCSRTQQLQQEISSEQYTTSLYNASQEFFNKSTQAFSDERHYAAASYCYTANLRLRQLLVDTLDDDVLFDNYYRLADSTDEFIYRVKNISLNTFSDLETYSIVRERLYETEGYLSVINESLSTPESDVNCTSERGCFNELSKQYLAFAIERYYSAIAWSGFFSMEGPTLQLDEQSVALAVQQELRSVQTRLSYLQTFVPSVLLTDIQSDVDLAFSYVEDDELVLALFTASKAKAQANMFLSAIGLREEKLPEVINAKLARATSIIAEQKDVFPIIGYSYKEYASELIDSDPFSALLFSEYALSLSDLSAYFPKSRQSFIPEQLVRQWLTVFIAGMLCGVLLTLFVQRIKQPKQRSGKRNTLPKRTSKKK